jgi:hypothetical protein
MLIFKTSDTMKSKIILKILLAVLTLITFSACEKDFLNITATDRISDQALSSDSALFEDFVINRYMGTRGQEKEGEGSPPGFGRGFEWAWWSSITDESIYNNDDATWLIQQGQLSPENTGIAGTLWGRSYRSIRECSYALEIINDIEMSQSGKKLLTAELKFIRAFRYVDLIKNYGRAVLRGDTVSNLGDDFTSPSLYKRSSIEECINYVVAQLDEAASGLPLINDDNRWLLGRATRGAALALKSRILLYAASPLYNVSDWQTAADAAKAVMDLGIYSLNPDYGSLFLTPTSNEIIFERLYTTNARHVCIELCNGPNGSDAWAGNSPLQNMVDAYEMNNGLPIDDPASGYNEQDPYINRDPRFYASILFNGAPFRGRAIETFTPGGRDSKDGPSNWNTSKTGYYLRKFMDDNNPIIEPDNIAGLQPWIYFRYAEILLNYAEALNEANGPDAEVYDAINEIRTRAQMPELPAGLTKEEMRERIRRERQVELAFEEHRFYDVRRWKIAEVTENVPAYGILITRTITPSDTTLTYASKVALDGRLFEEKHYWLPIPRADILSSNNQLEQNPLY